MATSHAGRRERALPAWPLFSLFGLFPVWWLLGLGDFVWPMAAVPMAAVLVMSRPIRIPPSFGLWLVFLLWMIVSVTQIDSAGRLAGFGFRALTYGSATVLFLYVYNSRRTLPLRKVVVALSVFWLVVVAGGWLGVLVPEGALPTVTEHLIPSALQSNELVSGMVSPPFAQYDPYSGIDVAPRPSAPFLYANNWGANYALLLPFALAAILLLRRGPFRLLLLVALPVSLVPAYLTQNRGMFLALFVGVLYVSARLLLRGNARALIAVIAFVAVGLAVASVMPVAELVQSRVEISNTNETRLTVYREVVARTLDSPVLGYGAPRPSESVPTGPAAGTQGQFWMVLFSHGYPGALFFMLWLVAAVLVTARVRSLPLLLTHVVCVLAVLESAYYGLLSSALHVAMVAAAVCLRDQGYEPGQPEQRAVEPDSAAPPAPVEAVAR